MPLASFFYSFFLEEHVPRSFDPQTLPQVAITNAVSMDLSRLSVSFLRERFQLDLDWLAESTGEALLNPDEGFKPASVLLPIVVREDGLQVLLTQRAAHLHHHPGQISFPGGRVDADDLSAEHTALREAQEEIGLHASQIEILGCLPHYFTGTGFAVTPVVALVHLPLNLQAQVAEVASIFEVPLQFLMDAENHQIRQLQRQLPTGLETRSFYAMPYQEYFIWGATAGILRNLFHFLRA